MIASGTAPGTSSARPARSGNIVPVLDDGAHDIASDYRGLTHPQLDLLGRLGARLGTKLCVRAPGRPPRRPRIRPDRSMDERGGDTAMGILLGSRHGIVPWRCGAFPPSLLDPVVVTKSCLERPIVTNTISGSLTRRTINDVHTRPTPDSVVPWRRVGACRDAPRRSPSGCREAPFFEALLRFGVPSRVARARLLAGKSHPP